MKLSNLSGKRVLVLGMGLSGRAAAEFLLAHGAIVCGADCNAKLLLTHNDIQALQQKGCELRSDQELSDLASFDFFVLSPGISPTHPIIQWAQQHHFPVLGEVELGCQFIHHPVWGITGTNGKTTVTLLITQLLNYCGQTSRALGNVGAPLTKELMHLPPSARVILELSSYQIETLYEPCLDRAVILNITPDHLDRYQNMEKYAEAKCLMERCLKPNGQFYMEENAWYRYGHLLKTKKPRLYGYDKTSFVYTDLQHVFRAGKKTLELPTSLKNKKSHDLENFLAAYALCTESQVADEDFLAAWHTFQKPHHRIEFIGTYKGVRFYDDSKGTNVDAVVRAVESLDGSVILIAGGVDKGSLYTPWIEAFRNKVKSICVIGLAAAKIKDQLASHFPVVIFSTLDDAVKQAVMLAKEGDNVLLSPGCASQDMFRDYAHRGQEFQRIVHALHSKVHE